MMIGFNNLRKKLAQILSLPDFKYVNNPAIIGIIRNLSFIFIFGSLKGVYLLLVYTVFLFPTQCDVLVTYPRAEVPKDKKSFDIQTECFISRR